MALAGWLLIGGASAGSWCPGLQSCGAQAAEIAAATPWIEKPNISKARLIAGRVATVNSNGSVQQKVAKGQLYAGVELVMADGWKTYWRNTGDAAGVPPYFDFKGSLNVRQAKVLYPGPHRFSTPDGDSIGYKHKVIFPIFLAAKDAGKPMRLKLTMDYGVCSEICVPARARFAVTIPPGAAMPLLSNAPLVSALASVPQIYGQRLVITNPRGAGKAQPALQSAVAKDLSGRHPRILFKVDYPGGLKEADLFVEGPDEAFVPQPQRVGKAQGNRLTFAIDLTKGADLTELRGKPLRLTLVSAAGQSEASWLLK